MNNNKIRPERAVVYNEMPPFPQNMLVELTNSCNHQCLFCAYKHMKRPKGFCNRENMLKIIREAYECGTREIGFYRVGEPFLSSDLEFFVRECKKIGFEYIYITTNGALADKERVYNLWKLGLSSIKFSVDAGKRSTYKIVHGRDDYDIVIKNLLDLVELKKDGMDLGIFASFMKLKISEEEVDHFMDIVGNKLDDVEINSAKEQCGNMPEIVDQLLDRHARIGKVPCSMLFNRLHVTYQGYLNACCLDIDDLLAVADLKKIHIKDAWYSDLFVQFRREHIANKIGNNMCYNCIYGTMGEAILPLNKELVQH